MNFSLMLALLTMGEYGEYIWPSYLISLGALVILAILSWRRKTKLENQVKSLENNNSKK